MQFGTQDGARLYQESLVPLMFASSARRLVASAALPSGVRVLDIATGTGVVARTAAATVGSSGRVTAIDLSAGMLAAARSQPAPISDAPIDYIEAAVEDATLPAEAFHSAFCQQGLQFFSDPTRALLRIRNALAPGGQLHIALWCAVEQHPLASSLYRALLDSGLEDFTSFLNKAHQLHDPAVVTALLEEGGFGVKYKEAVEILPDGIWHAADASRLLAATPLAQRLGELSTAQRASLEEACERQLDRYTQDGALDLRFPATFYTAQPA